MAEEQLQERLQALDQLALRPVGALALPAARHLGSLTGMADLYLKFEGSNPTGTHKDRIAYAHVRDAVLRGFASLTLATCGNYGVACALAARAAGLRCVIYLPEPYHTRRVTEMEKLGAEIRRHGPDYETAVEASQQAAAKEGHYDANPGGENTPLQLEAYARIAGEIVRGLGRVPDVVAAPVSNGTLLAGVYEGFSDLLAAGRIDRIPAMVAGSAKGQNPIVASFRAGRVHYEDLTDHHLRETSVNEPLINWHSSEGAQLLPMIRQTGGWAQDISDHRLVRTARLLRAEEGLQVLPAATAGLAALMYPPKGYRVEGTAVAIITSRR